MKKEGILSERLRFLSIKLSGMAYLIEGQSLNLPDEFDEAPMGISMIFLGLSQEIREISNALEEEEIKGCARS